MDKKSNSLGRLRYRGALLFVSVLLHSLLALSPWQRRSRPLMVPPTPVSPIPVVDASQIPQLSVSDSQQLPIVSSEPSPPPPAPATEVLPPVDIPVPLLQNEPVTAPSDGAASPLENRPTSEPALEESPYSDNVPTTTTSAATGESSPTTPAITPPDEAKIAADWENFVDHLQLQDNGFEATTLLDIFGIFGEPEQAKQFFDDNDQPKLDVLSYYLFPEQTPEQVWQTVVTPGLSSDTSLKLQPQEDFTSGLAYQLLQGEVLRYLIIVRLNERSGSVLILSNSLPEDSTAD
ncbi:MAG: hypothetical protein AAF716_11685 [Cyanobacteria bacterium P01_D01_bin.1]